jgi:hypothetical protein
MGLHVERRRPSHPPLQQAEVDVYAHRQTFRNYQRMPREACRTYLTGCPCALRRFRDFAYRTRSIAVCAPDAYVKRMAASKYALKSRRLGFAAVSMGKRSS